MKLLPEIPRTKNGYRIYNDSHLDQLRLLRIAFRAEIISGRLRQEVVHIVKAAAAGEIEVAYQGAQKYNEHLKEEKVNAEEAIGITTQIVENNGTVNDKLDLIGRGKLPSCWILQLMYYVIGKGMA